MTIPSNVSAIPEHPIAPQTTLPSEILLLREPEVVTLLKQILTTQEAMLVVLEKILAGRQHLCHALGPRGFWTYHANPGIGGFSCTDL